MYRIILHIFSLLFLLGACKPEEKPDILPPVLKLYEAREITRTTAIISGEIEIIRRGTVQNCRFVYGKTATLTDGIPLSVETTEGYTALTLSGLTAGTTYYYGLEVSNGYSCVRSDIRQFRTLPNSIPVLGEMSLINKGPFSATFQCSIEDNGGTAPSVLGFKYRTLSREEEILVTAQQTEGNIFKAKLTALDMGTTYSVRAFAANPIGEIHSLPVSFTTDQAIYTSIPGSLSDILDPEKKYTLTRLSISGRLNGSDLRLLRDLLGRDIEGRPTPGQLTDLDLTDADLVAGGLSYYESRYSKKDTLGYGTFTDCEQLQRLILPRSIKVIEKNAFRNCHSLTSLTLPDSLFEYTASEGCHQLKEFTVSPLNVHFSCAEGVLYDKSGHTLLQYPEGKAENSFTFPATVKKLASYSFLHCPLEDLLLPASVTTLGQQVFRASRLKSVIIGDGITTLPQGTFQDCQSLKQVTLGSEIALICSYCFSRCPVEHLYIRATYPPVCESGTFTDSDMPARCILHVPPGSKALYKNSKSWKNFVHIVEEP